MCGILVKPVEPGQGAGCHYYFALMGSQFFYCSDGMEGALFKVPIYIPGTHATPPANNLG